MKHARFVVATFLILIVLVCGRVGRAAPVPLKLGDTEPLPKSLYGFNSDLVAATAFEGITFGGLEMETAVRELRPQALRFPGGSTANNYLWRQDSFSEQTNDLTGWAGEQLRLFRKIGRPYDLPGYVRLCRQFKLKPVWVLNIYEETPASVTALLEYLDSLGLKLHAIELGNEPYWDPRSLNNVREYIRLCQPLVQALRQRRPDLKVGACFAPLIHEPFDYIEKWNAVLARETWYDAIVFHDYFGGQGFALEAGAKVPAKALRQPDKFIDDSIAALTRLVPGKPIWFTEWNLGQEGIKQWKNQGAELMFIGATFCQMLQHRDAIEISLFHQLYEKGFGAFYLDGETRVIRLNASYELFKLIGTALAKAEQFRPVTFASDDLLGFATQAPDGIRLFAINRGSTPLKVQLPPEFLGSMQRITLVCPPEARLGAADTFTQQADVVGHEVVLPAYSINLIASPAALKPPTSPGLAANLFPARPHLTLWYPPYASSQPRVSADGRYTLDLSAFKDKPMAVVKMDLSGLHLTAGATCALSFEARAEPDGALTVNLPESAAAATPAKNRTEWIQLGKTFRPVRLVFRLDPAVNNGEVNFFFDQELITKGGRYEFQNFRIVSLE